MHPVQETSLLIPSASVVSVGLVPGYVVDHVVPLAYTEMGKLLVAAAIACTMAFAGVEAQSALHRVGALCNDGYSGAIWDGSESSWTKSYRRNARRRYLASPARPIAVSASVAGSGTVDGDASVALPLVKDAL
jgi:hypothetical protein